MNKVSIPKLGKYNLKHGISDHNVVNLGYHDQMNDQIDELYDAIMQVIDGYGHNMHTVSIVGVLHKIISDIE